MSSGLILKIHVICVTIFLVFYLLKTFFLVSGKVEVLDTFTKNTRLAEITLSVLFLATGIWLFVITGGIKTFQVIKLLLIFVAIPLAVIGFSRKNKILALFSFIILVSAYGLAEAGRSKPYPVKHASAGKELFEQNCRQCHGVDGKKMYHDAADLSLSIKDLTKTETIIRNGRRNKMPTYGGLLSEEEIHAVASYILTLRE